MMKLQKKGATTRTGDRCRDRQDAQLPRPCETLPLAEAMKIASASVTTNHEMNQLLVIFLAPGSHTATDLLK